MAKRNKNMEADAEQPSREFSEYQSLLESEAFRDQGEPVSTVSLGGRREGTDQELARLSGGDPDVSPQGIDSGEETPGGSNPTPGQDLVDEIGGAVGVTYQDDEPLKFDEKYATRDKERWEN